MFSRRRSLFDFSRGRLTKAPRRKQADPAGGVGQTRLSVEHLEDRRLLAVDFQFNAASGTPLNVIQGFQDAGALWQSFMDDDVTVVVDIAALDLGGPLGSTGSNRQDFSYTQVRDALLADSTSVEDVLAGSNLPAGPNLDVFINLTDDNPNGSGSATPYVDNDGGANNSTISVPRANARALGLIAADDPGSDGSISFDTINFTFDFDRTDGITPGQTDFVFVATHEIGHLLGFSSGVGFLDVNDGQGGRPGPFNDDTFDSIRPLDLFRSSPNSLAANADLDLTADTRTKNFSIDGGVTNLGTFAQGVNNGDGDQASHWEDAATPQGIMDPDAGGGEFGVVTALDLLAFDVIGWDLAIDDRFEANNTIGSATPLGSEPEVTVSDVTIGIDDEDFYKYTANDTGKLIVNALFTHDVGDIDLEIQDSAGNVIASSSSTTDNETVIIPVVSQEMYFIRVFGFPNFAVNEYTLEIENFAAPAPAFVDLTPSSDTGASNDDNVTSDTTPTFLVQADLVDFRDMGITLLDQATIDPNNDGDATDATNDGAGVFVTLVNLGSGALVEGFANQVGASGFLWTFTPSTPLAAGEYFVSSAVQMVDGQQDPSRENGRAQLSDPLFITILAGGAGGNVSADLLDASDTGMFDNDNVTNKMSPAIQGIAPAGSTVRLFANGELVGQTTTGSDSSDDVIGPIGGIGGEPDDGLGLWEITTEPLADDAYDLRIEVEDAAGNVDLFNVDLDNDDATNIDLVVDTEAPNTPLLDLRDDTGENLQDEITNVAMPEFFMTTTDPNIALAQMLFTDNLKFRVFDRFENNAETLIYDSAGDAAADNMTTPGDMFTSLTALTRTLNLADGVHNLKLEVEDRAGNISHDFLLEVEVDTMAPAAVQPNLLASSDSGMFNDDNVTHKWQPAFDGVAEINNKVFVYATLVDPATELPVGNPILVGAGLVGSENSNNVPDDGLGIWEVTVEPMVEGVYDITVRFEDWAGNFTPLADSNAPENRLRIVIDKTEPNTPLLDLITDPVLGDTGRHDVDNITKQNQPVVTMTSEDPNVFLAEVLFDDNLKFRIYDRYESFSGQNTPEFLLYDSAADAAVDAVNVGGDMFTSLTLIEETLPQQFFALFGADGEAVLNQAGVGVLADGVHNLKLEVEDRAGNISHDFLLEIIVDTVTPPVSFGLPNVVVADDGLAADSDSGVTTDPTTFADRVTNDTTPRLWGRAEANTIVRVYNDRDADGVIDLLTDDFLGQTVAVPFDGNDAYPDGYWEITSVLDLNEIVGLPKDGVRRLLVTAEDVAGNPMPMANEIANGVDSLNIFIDTQGPQVYDPAGAPQAVHPTVDPTYDLFDPKPSVNGFTPLTNSITINVRDLPLRSNVDPNFLYDALQEEIAEIVGNYMLVGDHVGPIGITNVQVINAAAVNNQLATATIQLTFADFLPDDRYTLTVSDNLVDPANNHLDGESNATGPLDDPTFPSGDGVPGGDFVARFTIDSRPEIGSYVAQNIDIDINGNFVWDPANGQIGNDATNVDLTFNMNVANPATGAIAPGGFSTHDLVFAGQFTNGNAPASGRLFDMLAVYGWSVDLGGKRWLIDTNSDGVVNTADGDIISLQPVIANINISASVPVAGNFDGNVANGDEIGLYYAGQWALDSNRNFVIDAGDTFLNGNMLGHPVVGDFDGNGEDDLAVFNDNTLYFDMNVAGFDGFTDDTFIWGFPGVLDRPVAADMDWDGIDDIGLWVPRNSAQDNRPIAEWYFLVSGNPNAATRNAAAGTANLIDHPFETVPFGNDWYAEFGDELALPIVGNFDPPVVAERPTNQTVEDTGDFDQDGDVDGGDFLAMQRGYGMTSQASMSDGDGNSDGAVDSNDMQLWTDGYQARVAAASDFNDDGWVNDTDLGSWEAAYGVVSTPGMPGDATADGIVSGADFLALQRSYSQSTSLTLSAVASGEPAAVAAAVSAPRVVDLATLGGVAAYAESSGAVAKAAAFEVLEENVVEYVNDNHQFSAATSVSGQTSLAGEVESPTTEDEAWDLAFSDDEELLASLF